MRIFKKIYQGCPAEQVTYLTRRLTYRHQLRWALKLRHVRLYELGPVIEGLKVRTIEVQRLCNAALIIVFRCCKDSFCGTPPSRLPDAIVSHKMYSVRARVTATRRLA
jgi:hypothetical protein